MGSDSVINALPHARGQVVAWISMVGVVAVSTSLTVRFELHSWTAPVVGVINRFVEDQNRGVCSRCCCDVISPSRPVFKWVCVCGAVCIAIAGRMNQARHPKNFRYHKTQWKKFPDGTDNIKIGGFDPENQLRGSHVIFLASFHSNDATLSQLYVCIVLLEALIESLTIVLPFYPVGTMGESVLAETTTAITAATNGLVAMPKQCWNGTSCFGKCDGYVACCSQAHPPVSVASDESHAEDAISRYGFRSRDA